MTTTDKMDAPVATELRRVREFNQSQLNWGIVGPLGGVHIHISANFSHGGIEVHSNKPLYDTAKMSEEPCWLTGVPCCHDGSSLWFEEFGRYLLMDAIAGEDDARIWSHLELEYRRRLGERD